MTATYVFEDATRESAMARIAVQGPAGSGKTKTAIRIAEGLAQGGIIAIADTERRSALKYAPVPGRPDLGGHVFKHLPMDNHDPRNLIGVVEAAEAAGVKVLIVDSWSHFWNGNDGLLSIVDEAGSANRGGSFGGWKVGNKVEQDMLNAILNFRGHLIVTMRTKTDYVMEGKTVHKVGVKTVQREGAEYEVDVVLDMVDRVATVTKTRYDGLDGAVIERPGPEVGEKILEELGHGVDRFQLTIDELNGPGLTLDRLLQLQTLAHKRRFLTTSVARPDGGTVKLSDLFTARLGAIVAALLADPALTYNGALDLHQRALQGGWGNVPYSVDGDEPTPLINIIKARGQQLSPVRSVPQPDAPAACGDQAEDEARHLTDTELAAAAASGHPEVEAAAHAVMDAREHAERASYDGTGTAAEPDDGSSVPDPDGPSAPPQLRNINNLFAQLDMGGDENRGRRLTAAALLIQRARPLERLNDLTYGEAEGVLTHLFVLESSGPDGLRDHLNDLLQRAKAPTGAPAGAKAA
ncbi:AAA family ATPase [Streptomyces sp. NPDC088354]|uniref:AAA family ATPase n=1 Tax=Streptomyces sp. NPDC088354 TaxID=3365856 RepID=UPI0037F20511